MEDGHINKSHNKSLLLYHIVCPVKYRRKVLKKREGNTLKDVCKEISERYELGFIEMGTDEEYVHFLVQSVPMYLLKKVAQIIKNITAVEIFKRHPEVKMKLWGCKFWTSGYYVNAVGQYGNLEVKRNYVDNQGEQYHQLHRSQLSLF